MSEEKTVEEEKKDFYEFVRALSTFTKSELYRLASAFGLSEEESEEVVRALRGGARIKHCPDCGCGMGYSYEFEEWTCHVCGLIIDG